MLHVSLPTFQNGSESMGSPKRFLLEKIQLIESTLKSLSTQKRIFLCVLCEPWGVIHCCWLTAVIHCFSSEFDGQVSAPPLATEKPVKSKMKL
jgi:hypothetical protein